MCVVSMVGDWYHDKWKDYPPVQPYYVPQTVPATTVVLNTGVSQEEFDKLKKEVEDMKELLRRAKIYDEKNNEPNCEIEEKMKFLRRVAEAVGINLDDVIPENKK